MSCSPALPGSTSAAASRATRAASHIPIILLTAKAQERDRVHGLELGADDYVTKPFSPRELVLRVQAQIRKLPGHTTTSDSLQIGEIVVDRAQPSAEIDGRPARPDRD